MSSPRSRRELGGCREPPGAAGSCREPPGAAGSCREPGAVMSQESRQKPPGAVRSRRGAARSGRELSGAVRSQPGEPPGAAGSRQEPPWRLGS